MIKIIIIINNMAADIEFLSAIYVFIEILIINTASILLKYEY